MDCRDWRSGDGPSLQGYKGGKAWEERMLLWDRALSAGSWGWDPGLAGEVTWASGWNAILRRNFRYAELFCPCALGSMCTGTMTLLHACNVIHSLHSLGIRHSLWAPKSLVAERLLAVISNSKAIYSCRKQRGTTWGGGAVWVAADHDTGEI